MGLVEAYAQKFGSYHIHEVHIDISFCIHDEYMESTMCRVGIYRKFQFPGMILNTDAIIKRKSQVDGCRIAASILVGHDDGISLDIKSNPGG